MTTYQELITIRDFIRYATSVFNGAHLFFGHGTDNALDEAMALILHTLHLPHDTNPFLLNAHLIEAERQELIHLIKQRVEKRIPVPYLTHEAWFAGLTFYVDERVLIPRSPIAELIENHFEPWILARDVNHILDLCTGSGCIAIACAQQFPEANVDATDVSADALKVAEINVKRYQLQNQVTLHQSNLFEQLANKKYDLIVTNPPYVDQNDMDSLPEEYRHEPKLGLAAGADGLDLVRQILQQAANHLNPQGIIVVEVGNSETALMQTFPTIPFTWLEFERGGGGVFVLTAAQIQRIDWNQLD